MSFLPRYQQFYIGISLALLAGLNWSLPAQAALIRKTSGGLTVVADDLTNQEWLTLDQTNDQSPNQALAVYGSQGFAWATATQVNQLLAAAFDPPLAITGARSGNQNASYQSVPAGTFDTWSNLMGVSSFVDNTWRYSSGTYDDGSLTDGQQRLFYFREQIAAPDVEAFNDFPNTFSDLSQDGNRRNGFAGVFLVRDTPAAIPTPAMLPGLVGLGMSVWRRQRKFS
ncbi:PTPA-CTERM sorting domain-containing protein [filamentous cyanobacterium LEGE 11480]|uniref:PTPA-CTERM sorting domain-containing protein n=1 Tax=Romeriopsis navalis LEGE 11480 TaxID=2777977 RepID=A0A928VL68_9CYAN|nr:PTPA-CTERM sorting domain-containing protein [Romeriopsis navalis]MBE9028402.1 PTPA-CTERM sorting domain-containing protein [Romeriopsis navalis LEGE 11480]